MIRKNGETRWARVLVTSCAVGLGAACSGTTAPGGEGSDAQATGGLATGTTTGAATSSGSTTGSTVVTNPDGSMTIVAPDGTTTTVPAGGATTGTTSTTTGTTAPMAPTLTPLQDPNVTPVDPGHKTLHRLNNAEYNNTVRDLLGTSLRPADDFVGDDQGAGFDNVANVLNLSATHLDMYASAARELVTEALSNGAQRERLVSCDLASQGSACAREVLAGFLPRAWRRPVTDAEIERFMGPVDVALGQGEAAEAGLAAALRAVLISPSFLFRVELDASPTDVTPHALTPHELASRLSYFLWSSMPDAELFALAEAGTLGDPGVLATQVTRMLQDPKADALVQNFAGQWLSLRAVSSAAPDPQTFPEFDDGLRAAMRAESELLFEEVITTGAPLTTLLVADFTYVSDRLAEHYGLAATGSSEPVRVSLGDSNPRRGFLSHAGFLTVTSHPRSTSPVNRGKWVMDNLLCQTIPPPPPDVSTDLGEELAEDASLRQRLEAHRANPVCNSCHSLMDPIGLGLENFDPIGEYRTAEASGAAIDASGTLPDGRSFSGAIQLLDLLAADPNFGRCVAKKLFTYALGRPPGGDSTTFDPSTIDALTSSSNAGSSFEALVTTLATSAAFTQRRGEGGAL